jgi:CPA1 family monovalent cation:H+ antiporter
MFGALISPTDPVAVIAILRRAGTPAKVETRVCGESLFNDGVGVVVFSIAYAAAVEHSDITLVEAGWLFLTNGIGGLVFGGVIGWLGYRSLRAIDDPPVETLITLALVMGGYALADRMGFSPVVALAAAGVVIASLGKPEGMTERSRTYILGFWETIDEVLNAILFLLIGLEVIAITHSKAALGLAAIAVPVVMASRGISVGLPYALTRLFRKVDPRSLPIFVWGGLRGGISIALALSLPSGDRSETILTATYIVVLFSVVVQGLTLKPLAQWLYARRDD